MGGQPQPGKPLSPIPEPIGAGDVTQAKVFTGPRDALMRGSHWELCFLHWEEKGWVKLQRSGRKLECIPQWESILGGVYDPGQEASYEGACHVQSIPHSLSRLLWANHQPLAVSVQSLKAYYEALVARGPSLWATSARC